MNERKEEDGGGERELAGEKEKTGQVGSLQFVTDGNEQRVTCQALLADESYLPKGIGTLCSLSLSLSLASLAAGKEKQVASKTFVQRFFYRSVPIVLREHPVPIEEKIDRNVTVRID